MKSNILFAAFSLAVIASLYLTYERAVIRQDFEVTDSSSLDLEAE